MKLDSFRGARINHRHSGIKRSTGPVQVRAPAGSRVPVERFRSLRKQGMPHQAESWTTLDVARELVVKSRRLERGGRPAEKLNEASARRQRSQGAGSWQGPLSGRAMMAAPDAHGDIDSKHPLYGRYLEQWLQGGPKVERGRVLLQMLQSRLRDLKEAVRSIG